jgi:hypothetical protein
MVSPLAAQCRASLCSWRIVPSLKRSARSHRSTSGSASSVSCPRGISRAKSSTPGRTPSPDSRSRASPRIGRPVPPQRVRHLAGLPDRDHLPPPVAGRHRQVPRRAAAPVRNGQDPRGLPAVWPEIGGTEPHRGHLSPTGPASLTKTAPIARVEPDGSGHWITASTRCRPGGWRSPKPGPAHGA